MFIENFTAKGAKTANKKGRDQGELPPSLKRGNESREGRRGPRSYCSRCSRFKFLNRSVRCNFHRERRENREQKRECLRKPLIHSQKGLPKGICPKSRATGVFLSLPSYHRWLRKTCESLYWFASPCSRRSRCSRFMILNRSVH